MISVIILTKNEELNLPSCLHSIKMFDDVSILDSGSTDRTIEIAKQNDIPVYYNSFKSFGKQRNFALDHIDTKYDWILFLDADEVVSEKFRISMLEATENAEDDIAGYYCCWKMMLEGKWLKHCDNFPKWQLRLVRKGMARFKDFGHGQKEDKVAGRILYIKEPYLHYCFSKGWAYWIERHNRYSSQEAEARLNECPPLKDILSGNGTIRNPALKSWLSRLPGWPMLRFLHAYLINLGFLEGVPGFIYCANMGYYEFLIRIKMREINKHKLKFESKFQYRKEAVG
jgi:glycosyltransferase involved in cell wall biosynthesis